ncbi:MAG: HAD-IC family P-type ATPase, partial [Anaerolineae bacterium]|nr:HAD-IC family P-type ATPase [Anaerolineae bacterium]
GTLTANRINFSSVYPVGIDENELHRVLGIFASSASVTNKTSEALNAGLGEAPQQVNDEVPFSSARKWSALAFDLPTIKGTYVLGAKEMLAEYMDIPAKAQAQIEQWSDQGLRVLVFGHNAETTTLHNADDEPQLPPLTLLGVVCFSDELRPYLKESLVEFANAGINLKIISGDNPQTVAALATQAGLPGDLKYIAGPELNKLSDAQFLQVAEETTVFGRITPDQKEKLVDALRQQGHYVAMIGDGVNDVLSLKKANLGIAMESGSSATRAVADMILLKDSFSALPPAFTEGQRIVNGMKDIMRLFLTRVLYSALLIIAVSIIGLGFPFIPKQNSLLVFLTVGIPTFGLAVWARPGPLPKHGLLREIAHFVFPASISIFVFGVLVYLITFIGGLVYSNALNINITPDVIASFEEYAGIDYTLATTEDYQIEVAHLSAQTALTAFTCFAGLLLIVFVEPPSRYFVGGDEYSGDIRPTLIAGLMLLIYLLVLAVEPLRRFFEIIELPLLAYVAIALTTVIWMMVLRIAWRQQWLQRFLQVDLN